MVAIDVTPVRPIEEALATHEIPTNLPSGWGYESVLDTAQETAAPIAVQKIVSLNVPQGATSAQLFIISGLIGLLAGVAILLRVVEHSWSHENATAQKIVRAGNHCLGPQRSFLGSVDTRQGGCGSASPGPCLESLAKRRTRCTALALG